MTLIDEPRGQAKKEELRGLRFGDCFNRLFAGKDAEGGAGGHVA